MIYTKTQIIKALETQNRYLENQLYLLEGRYNEKYEECERLKDKIKDLLKNYNGLRKAHEKVKKMGIQTNIQL